jgi:hypothetical protein
MRAFAPLHPFFHEMSVFVCHGVSPSPCAVTLVNNSGCCCCCSCRRALRSREQQIYEKVGQHSIGRLSCQTGPRLASLCFFVCLYACMLGACLLLAYCLLCCLPAVVVRLCFGLFFSRYSLLPFAPPPSLFLISLPFLSPCRS